MANAASSASSPGAGSSSSQQAGGDGGGDAHTPRQRQGRPPRAGSDPLLIVCGCFSVVTVATALLCVAVNVVSAVQSFRAGSDVRGPPRSSATFPFPSTPALGADSMLPLPSADIRGHIPVLRGRLLAIRRRPRDRVGVHHPFLEGWFAFYLHRTSCLLWNLDCRESDMPRIRCDRNDEPIQLEPDWSYLIDHGMFGDVCTMLHSSTNQLGHSVNCAAAVSFLVVCHSVSLVTVFLHKHLHISVHLHCYTGQIS